MVIDKNSWTLLPAAILLTVGLVLFLVGLVGCVGAVKEHKCIIGLVRIFFTARSSACYAVLLVLH